MNAFFKYLGTTAAVALTINIIPGISYTGGWATIMLVAVVWSVIVIVIRPVLRALTLPMTILTFGLFSFVLNAFLFYAMSSVVPGFTVAGFLPALFGSAVLSALTWLIQRIL